jgi:hypothetical protein
MKLEKERSRRPLKEVAAGHEAERYARCHAHILISATPPRLRSGHMPVFTLV